MKMGKAVIFALITIVIAGLCIGTGEFTNASEDCWETLEPMPTVRSGISVAVVDGKIYAIGGSYDSLGETEVYDPVTNTWTQKTPMPTPRSRFGIAVFENKIYTLGGDSGNWSAGETPTNIVEVYDPASDSWETKAPMNIKRVGLSANMVDGKIYVIGGKMGNPSTQVSATEVYDPLTDTWTVAKQIPTPVNSHASAVVENKIYILGGAVRLSFNQIYDTKTDTWSTGASLPVGIDGAAADTIFDVSGDPKIYVVGGKIKLDAVNLTQVYDPLTDTWSTATSMPTARYMLGAAVLDDALYVIGGREGWFGSPISTANEKYVPIKDSTINAPSSLCPSPSFSPSSNPSETLNVTPPESTLPSPSPSIPEFPTWTIILLIVIVLVSVTLKKKALCRGPEAKSHSKSQAKT